MVLSDLSTYLATPHVQVILVIVLVSVIVRSFFKRQDAGASDQEQEEDLPPMEKRDFNLAELKKYNGKDDPRILLGINAKVYDVTKGKGFYGPGGPYGIFAGRDASRCFATFSTDSSIIKDEDDDLSDLNSMQMDSLLEWEVQISEKYIHVGKLLKAGERHTNYKAEESESESESKSESEKKLD